MDASKRKGMILWGSLFLLLAVRACAAGFRYWPQMDDYIQYVSYAHAGSFLRLAEAEGLLTYRPLAGIMDHFVWGKMFGFMLLAVLLISAAYVVYIRFLVKVLSRYTSVSPVTPVILALLPLGVEGTYWMSASSRIVPGLLTGILAVHCLTRWLDSGKPAPAFLYLLLQLAAFGFYEQSAVLSAALALAVAVLERKKHEHRVLLALWSPAAAGLYLLYVRLMASGNPFAGRAGILLPNTPYYYKVFLPELLRQIRTVLFDGGFSVLLKGFLRGVKGCFTEHSVLPFFLALALSISLFDLFGRSRNDDEAPAHAGCAKPLLLAFWLAAAALSPFFFLENPYFTFRGAVPVLAGIALAADTLLQQLLRLLKQPSRRMAAAAAVLMFLFSVAGFSEIFDYRETYLRDQRIAASILEVIPEDAEDPSVRRVGIFCLAPSGLEDQNYRYHGHIDGCTESGWALFGLVTASDNARRLPEMEPLPAGEMYARWNADARRPDSFDKLYWYDEAAGEVLPASAERTGENEYVIRVNGEPYGRIREDDEGCGRLEPFR